MEVGHSRLLKFFKSGRSIQEMAELPVIKIQKDYESPPNVESEVPGTHKMREFDENSLNNTENSELEIGGAQFTLSPVITVTQKESTLTKDGVKSHKMTVTEDIAMGDTENGGLRVRGSLQQNIVGSRSSRTQIRKKEMENLNLERDKSQEDKKSKIPIKRLRQAVEKVKKERKDQKERERQQNQPRRSSLPKLKESKIPTKRHTSLKLDPKTEDEFEKIYEEIVDNKLKDIDDKILEVKIEDTEIVESKFEEIIHAYDEDVEEKPTISRISKIPALRRRDEDRTSKIGALVDRVKAKTPTAESELKDGGFRVTASNITIKRFSRGTSRDLNQDNAITVAKESVESESIDKTTKTAPVKPARTYRRKNSEKDNFKYEAVEKNDIANDSTQTTIKESSHVVTPVKPERVKRGVSREVKKDEKGTVVIEKFEDNNSKTEIISTKSEGDGTITKTTTIEREVHSGIPIRTERLIRSFSQGVHKEKPVTEKISRHLSSKTGEQKIINESNDEKTASITTNKKETTKDSVTATPVKPERFTRGISREMGNIRLKDDSDILRDFRETGSHNIIKRITSKGSVTKDSNSEVVTTKETKEQIGNTIKETFVKETVIEETTSKIDDSVIKEVVTDENGIRKETMQTEYLIKEGIKVGIPVFTKTTENSSENVEASSTDEVKSYIRSASENIIRTELKDSSWKRTPSFIKDTNVNNKETVTSKYTSSVSMQEGFKSDVTENVSSSVTIKKVTEYQTKEEKTNIEMNSYMLRNPFDFSIKRDAYDFKNENVKKTELKQEKNEIKETTESTTAKEIRKPVISDTVEEKKETEHIPVPADEKDSDTEEVTVLKGNVSRLKSKISSIGNAKTTKQEDIGLPRSTSVSSKIAVFERLESGESISKDEKLPEVTTLELEANAAKVEEKPKIVEELLKYETYDERDKIKIGFNYDEVVYMTEAKIVDEFWKSAEGNDDNVSTVNPVINNIPITETKENGDDIEPITPEIVTVNSVKTIHVAKEIASTLPGKVGNKTIDRQNEVARPLPALINKNETDKVIEPTDNKTNIKPDYYELPKILPDKDYETEIGKTKPGKINLNIWKTQVAVNKTLVDKRGIIKNENVEEIAKALPDKLSFIKNHVQVSKVLPETVDLKENKEGAKTLPVVITFNIEEARNVPTIVPGNLNYKANASTAENDTLNEKDSLSIIDDKTKISEDDITEPIIEIDSIPVSLLEPPKIPPPNIPEKDSYKSQYMDTSKKDSKPIPGKINLNLWKNQVETNKTLLSKKQVKSKDFEFPKTFNKHIKESKSEKSTSNYETQKSVPSKVSVISTEVETPRALPAKIDFTPENKVQPIRALPAFIDVKATENEPIRTLPGFININTSESNDELTNEDVNIVTLGEAKTFPATIELKASESQIEEPKNLIGYTDYKESVYNEKYSTSTISNISVSTIDSNISEQLKSLPGKLDLRAWETQVEVNKTLLGTITPQDNTIEIIEQIETDTSESENNEEDFKENADFLPANNDFTIIKTSQINTINLGAAIAENSSLDEESVEENDLNNNTTIAVTTDLEPKESLSDPELVIDEPELKERKASIMNRIRNKLYFINYKNIVRNTAIKNLAAEKEANSNNTEHLSTKTNAVDSQAIKEENETANTEFKETNKFIEETYHKIVKEYTSKQIINKTNIDISKTEDLSNVTESNYSKKELVTEESSKYGIKSDFNEEFRRNREEMKRAKSVAELDLGDAVNGKVKQILSRIKSVDFDRRNSIRVEKINIKEMPKKMSVLEKIALFEGKGATQSVQPVTTRIDNSEEMYEKKIESLKAAKEKYGSIDKMPVLTLSGSQSMPIIAFGTALGDPKLLPHLIKAAIDLGYRAFDTAYIYGNEKEIGQAINEKIQDGTVKREDLFIMSKLWSTFHRQDLVETACRSSLKNLGLDYFDLYMIHNPMSFKEGPDPIPKIASVVQYSDHDYLEAWFGMETLVSGGLARNIGVSNFNTQQLQRILDKGRLAPAVNQVECHPYLSQERLHAFCTERNITLSCFGVLGSKGTPAELKNSTTAVIDDPLVKVMASGLNVTPAQLLIRYQIEYGHNVVVKASSAEHLWDNLQALTFSLDAAQLAALHALNKNRRTFTFQGMGDTHKNYPFTNGN